ncbi:MAG TPA: hypothetical protein VHD61_14590 [Lacunisphaera sp.]|nr:hypothetical protein [Lacunisphaera sp.]
MKWFLPGLCGLLPALLVAKSVTDIADRFVAPPAFQLVKQEKGTGFALISKRLTREWSDPFGTQLGFGVDDSNVLPPAYVSSKFADLVGQVKEKIPGEKVETAQIFNVRGHDWITIRLRGEKLGHRYLRVVALGEMGGLLAEIELVGSEAETGDLGRYLTWILQDNSPTPPNASNSPAPKPPPEKILTPQEAIFLAASAAPNGADGIFELTVRSTGRRNDTVFLNSELDYRDQRSLAVRIPPIVVAEYIKRYGAAPDVALKGKRIRVTGEALRTTITFVHDGVKTDKFYYQTHLPLLDLRQLEVLPDAEPPKK